VPNQSKTLAPISKDLDISTVIPGREQRMTTDSDENLGIRT